ncbi:hypothetical protein BGX28_004213 [Mortierella sp. GBA30]|nr:hypothetical protein BGX28_004213 [Mortierella sp. GBA30]
MFALQGPQDSAMRTQDTISEREYRAVMLAQNVLPDFKAQGWFDPPTPPPEPTKLPNLDCTAAPNTVSMLLSELSGILDPLESGTFMDLLGDFIEGSWSTLLRAVAKGVNRTAVLTIKAVVVALNKALTVISDVKELKYVLKPVFDLLKQLCLALNTLVDCTSSASEASKLVAEAETRCTLVADLYRFLLKGSIKQSPRLSESAPENLKRVVAGSLSVLNLMDSTSIADKNEAILATRPIFSADLLDQYRQEMLYLAGDDEKDVKKYAHTDLAVVISISNALRACLRAAADLKGAAEHGSNEPEACSMK